VTAPRAPRVALKRQEATSAETARPVSERER
jgi:hypothetical protein